MGMFLPIAALAVSAGAGVHAARTNQAIAEGQSKELERQAELEKLMANDRELSRRRRLNQVLAGQIAATGAGDIMFEGSPLAVARDSIEQSDLDHASDSLASSSRINSLRSSAINTRNIARANKRLSLLTTASRAVRTGSSIAESGA